MPKSGLGEEKEDHAILAENFKHQEALKMYEQLPDYDEFQGYYLGIDSEFPQMDGGVYANFHMPSWQTLMRHLPQVGIRKQLLRHLENLAGYDKKDDFKQERMFGRAAKKSKWKIRLTNR